MKLLLKNKNIMKSEDLVKKLVDCKLDYEKVFGDKDIKNATAFYGTINKVIKQVKNDGVLIGISWNDVKDKYLEFHKMDKFTENMARDVDFGYWLVDNCIISDVSNQKELLIDFVKWYKDVAMNYKKNELIKLIDNYIEINL